MRLSLTNDTRLQVPARRRTYPGRPVAAILALVALGLLAPIAAAQGLAGTYRSTAPAGEVTVTLDVAGETLTGSLSGLGVELTLLGTAEGDAAYGLAFHEEEFVAFEAYLTGDYMVIYLVELDESGTPIEGNVIELALTHQRAEPITGSHASPPPPDRSAATGSDADDPVLVVGTHATLTLDNAKAFLEALEFVLDQIGYAYELTDADRAQALEELAAGYPEAAPEDQVLLAQSREVWQRVQANWDAAAVDEQEEFALGVLVLAFGEETVRSWLSSGSVSGSVGGGLGATADCATFEDCTSSFVDQQTWSDTFNTQGCWAAAGCGGYDPSTNTFTYDGY